MPASIAEGTLITAAVNGARRGKADHPRLPISPTEIAAECRKCRTAGAAMAHVHARDEAGEHVLDPGRFREVIDAIEHATDGDLVIQVTTETIGKYGPEDITSLIKDLEPEAASFALSELIPAANDERHAEFFLGWVKEAGIFPQFILYDADDLVRFKGFLARQIIPWPRPPVLFVLGRYRQEQGSVPADLDPFIEALGEEKFPWAMCAFGAREHDCVRHAIALGGHVRVGLENNLYLPSGELAGGTCDLVALAAGAASESGRPALSAGQLRRAIGADGLAL